jgi:hypothetical protein
MISRVYLLLIAGAAIGSVMAQGKEKETRNVKPFKADVSLAPQNAACAASDGEACGPGTKASTLLQAKGVLMRDKLKATEAADSDPDWENLWRKKILDGKDIDVQKIMIDPQDKRLNEAGADWWSELDQKKSGSDSAPGSASKLDCWKNPREARISKADFCFNHRQQHLEPLPWPKTFCDPEKLSRRCKPDPRQEAAMDIQEKCNDHLQNLIGKAEASRRRFSQEMVNALKIEAKQLNESKGDCLDMVVRGLSHSWHSHPRCVACVVMSSRLSDGLPEVCKGNDQTWEADRAVEFCSQSCSEGCGDIDPTQKMVHSDKYYSECIRKNMKLVFKSYCQGDEVQVGDEASI